MFISLLVQRNEPKKRHLFLGIFRFATKTNFKTPRYSSKQLNLVAFEVYSEEKENLNAY